MSPSSSGRRVVVGVRGDETGPLDFAAGLAAGFGTGLRVVHACQVPYPYGYGPHTAADLPENLVAPGRRVVAAAQEHLDTSLAVTDVEYDLVVGFPPAVLGAESTGAKAVVVGTDDAGWLDRVTGEAVTNFLCLHSSSPIVVVPLEISSFAVDEIVVAVDGRGPERGPMQFAFEIADRLSLPVRVVHVMSHREAIKDIDSARLVLAETMAGWAETYPDVSVSTVLAEGRDPAEETTDLAGEGSLVVAGRPAGGPARRWRAPVTHALTRAGVRPVAVVPPRYTV
ncbi:universal stress protein [Aeromicrobium wangtongii]|uniref:universal stress protein n=1 Tax=Aeromicrobium wangtongii TaxID=2969247 RepID=UPI002017D7EE|nr:universal stress protein [Aeromicrobium wangtongii]MCL3819284.1 universal stress protein [Aeromicrobium wangtongii]